MRDGRPEPRHPGVYWLLLGGSRVLTPQGTHIPAEQLSLVVVTSSVTWKWYSMTALDNWI